VDARSGALVRRAATAARVGARAAAEQFLIELEQFTCAVSSVAQFEPTLRSAGTRIRIAPGPDGDP